MTAVSSAVGTLARDLAGRRVDAHAEGVDADGVLEAGAGGVVLARRGSGNAVTVRGPGDVGDAGVKGWVAVGAVGDEAAFGGWDAGAPATASDAGHVTGLALRRRHGAHGLGCIAVEARDTLTGLAPGRLHGVDAELGALVDEAHSGARLDGFAGRESDAGAAVGEEGALGCVGALGGGSGSCGARFA
jgi:hypothetical protein